MGFRPHIHTKHEIEYDGPSFGLNYAHKEVLNWLKENGVKVLSAMENITDSPEGIIIESLLEGMNQNYSAELSQKVNRG